MVRHIQPTTLVDTIGTRRRIQALVSMGHPPIPLAAHLGMTTEQFWELLESKGTLAPQEIHDAARDLFDALWDLRIDGPLGDEMRELARRRRWVGPLAWDDIDDPHEKPNLHGSAAAVPDDDPEAEAVIHIDEIAVERAIREERVKLTRPERLLAITKLHAKRLNDKVIARMLHINDRTVLRARQELGLEPIDPMETREMETA